MSRHKGHTGASMNGSVPKPRKVSKQVAEFEARDHTPEGWLPANRRAYIDPLSRAARRRATSQDPDKGDHPV